MATWTSNSRIKLHFKSLAIVTNVVRASWKRKDGKLNFI